MSVFQFPRIRARMTQRQRVNYAWWQTSRNRVVASPGKTAAVGEATEQGKITPGAVGMDQFVKMSYRGVFVTHTKVLGILYRKYIC